MNYLLLLGAGFSKNWNGPLATEVFNYLLGCKEIREDEYLKSLLMQHQHTGGFESALAVLQDAWMDDFQKRQFDREHFSQPRANLDKFQSSIAQMFRDINDSFSKLPDWEFQNEIKFMLKTFLAKFDAIFTLNQDLLFETHYRHPSMLLAAPGKWDGWHIPGMREAPYLAGNAIKPVRKWLQDRQSFEIPARHQPYFKLHGSSEWRDGSDKDLLVMGNNKSHTIQSHEVLKWYFKEFSSRLTNPNTRLMIIGYGFGDQHINHAIMEACQNNGLHIFIIDPSGIDAIRKTNLTFVRPHNIYAPNNLENALLPKIIGTSTRHLKEIFGENSSFEHSQVMRFFN